MDLIANSAEDGRKEMAPVGSRSCERAVQAIGGKWKLVLLWHLLSGPLRYGALRRRVPEVSERVLIRQLRELEADGLVHREQFPEVPPRVEYSATTSARALAPVIDGLSAWAETHLG